MGRKNHYEAAFENFLRKTGIPYLSNRQEFRNPLDDGSTLKNFDYIVSDPNGCNWIVDVKGRRFPGGQTGKRFWKHWTTGEDLSGLLKWESYMGNRFKALFVFAYLINGDRAPLPEDRLFTWKKRLYAFLAVPLHDYIAQARLISPRWQTFEMPVRTFRALARPFDDFLH